MDTFSFSMPDITNLTGASILKDTKPTENRQCGYINVMFKFVKLTVCDKSHELNAGFGAICEVKGI